MFGTAILPARPGPGSLLRGDADDEASLVRSPEFSPASRGRGAFFFFLGLGRSSVAVLPLPSALGSTAGEAGLATPSPRAANGPAPRASLESGPGPDGAWGETFGSGGESPEIVAACSEGVTASDGSSAEGDVVAPLAADSAEGVFSSAGLAESSPVLIGIRRNKRGAELS